jgi:hypothetical protein
MKILTGKFLYYARCQSHIVALAAVAQPAKLNIVVLCNREQYIKNAFFTLFLIYKNYTKNLIVLW